jgi:type VI secretion system protein ImpG
VLKDFYQHELANLRELGVEFSRGNPALAPMLAAKGDDPDVERLLEGVAFLSSLIRCRLSEGYPELIQSLLSLVCPRVLYPTPSHTMMLFRPVQGFAETIVLPRGAQMASVKVDGAAARFSTVDSLSILPAVVAKASVERAAGDRADLVLQLASSAPLGRWLPDRLHIHFAGDYPEASERRGIILGHTAAIEAEVKGRSISLGRQSLSPGGFGQNHPGLAGRPLLPVYILKDYFTMPQQFLFLSLDGLGALSGATDASLVIRFRLTGLSRPLPSMRPEHFLLNVCPAVNVFPHQAQPLVVDHRSEEYLLRPQDWEAEKLGIYSVSQVGSIAAGGHSKSYVSFENIARAGQDQGLYSILRRQSPISGKPEHYIRIVYRPGDPLPARETLSVSLHCHNEGLTDYLRTGEISQPTDSSPSMATFQNIIPPTRHSPPAAVESQQWKLLSHLYMNITPFFSGGTLKDILSLHAGQNDADLGRGLANRKRIEAVVDARSRLEDLFIRGLPVRGTRVDLTVDPSGFASRGDLRLFGDVLDEFLGLFHHINSYSRLVITEKNSLEVLSWPPRLGLKRLI